jgi:anti-sigma B factor antagonist
MKIDTRVEPGRIVVAVCGEIDMAVCDDLAIALDDAVDRAQGGLVVVDLSHTSFMDSTGIRTLLRGHQAATATSAGFRVIGAAGVVGQVLEVTGLLDILTRLNAATSLRAGG